MMMGIFVSGVEFDVKLITDSCQPPITDSMLKSNVPTGTGQQQSAVYTVIETETFMSISYIWSAFIMQMIIIGQGTLADKRNVASVTIHALNYQQINYKYPPNLGKEVWDFQLRVLPKRPLQS